MMVVEVVLEMMIVTTMPMPLTIAIVTQVFAKVNEAFHMMHEGKTLRCGVALPHTHAHTCHM